MPNFVLWFMGPTSSGKTTLSDHLLGKLRARNETVIHFDGDEVRDFFGQGHGFSADDRLRVVATLVHLANKSSAAGVGVLVSALTANADAREYISSHTNNLIVGHVKCSINTCAERDPKGLYARAKHGEIDTLVGFNTPYHAPDSPDLVIDTEKLTLDQSTQLVIDYLVRSNYIALTQ